MNQLWIFYTQCFSVSFNIWWGYSAHRTCREHTHTHTDTHTHTSPAADISLLCQNNVTFWCTQTTGPQPWISLCVCVCVCVCVRERECLCVSSYSFVLFVCASVCRWLIRAVSLAMSAQRWCMRATSTKATHVTNTPTYCTRRHTHTHTHTRTYSSTVSLHLQYILWE